MAELPTEKTANLPGEDQDDDDDQLNSSHKVIPAISQSNSTVHLKKSIIDESFNPEQLIKEDLLKYVQTVTPKDHPSLIQCQVKREKEGLTKVFSLYFLGENSNDQILLLNARKHLTIVGHSEFFIGVNIDDPSKNLNEQNCIAKLRSTKVIGHEYILQDSPKTSLDEQTKPQSLAIIYDEHRFGSSDPTTMTVLLHNTVSTNRPVKDHETIIDEWRAGLYDDFLEFKNKSPIYNEESKRYTMQFLNDRVEQPSHKNFQLVRLNEQQEETVFMQFGRIDENTFALDYRYPLTAIEAFAIALSSFHNRFRT